MITVRVYKLFVLVCIVYIIKRVFCLTLLLNLEGNNCHVCDFDQQDLHQNQYSPLCRELAAQPWMFGSVFRSYIKEHIPGDL